MSWIAVVVMALAAAPPAAAHIPFYEPEQLQPSTGADWTIKAPFEIPLGDGYTPTLNTSRAILSVLGANPSDLYDAAAFEVTANGPSQTVIGMYALAPGCDAFADFYPSVALLGLLTDKRFTAPPTNASLPFEIPEGYGAIIVAQPRVERALFVDGPIVRYFLPGPLADWERCITSAAGFRECDPNNEGSLTMDEPLAPGRYYVVWWDPDRTTADAPLRSVPGEPVINLGFTEEATAEEKKLQVEVMTGQVRPAFAACMAGMFGPPGAEMGGGAMGPGAGPASAPPAPPTPSEEPAASGAAAMGLSALAMAAAAALLL